MNMNYCEYFCPSLDVFTLGDFNALFRVNLKVLFVDIILLQLKRICMC